MVEIKDRSKLIKSLKSRIYSYKNRDKRHDIENTDILNYFNPTTGIYTFGDTPNHTIHYTA